MSKFLSTLFLLGCLSCEVLSTFPSGGLCVGDMLMCDAPEDVCLHKSNRCDGETDCVFTGSDEIACPGAGETFCADDFVKVPGANDGYCYHLKPLDDGPSSFPDALAYCNDLMSYLPRPNSLAQVEALADWMGITGDPKEGYWMGYKRNIFAPLEADLTLSAENRAIRKNKTLFYDLYSTCPQVQMPVYLWRAPNQPGEKDDVRDEMCVAKKRAGSGAPAHLIGADDFVCQNGPKHYVICERCCEIEPTPQLTTTTTIAPTTTTTITPGS